MEAISDKEEQQNKHYLLQSELQNMAREIPGKYQQRVPYDLLCGLASALIDGTVFEIVRSLKEVQHLEERNLYNQRSKLINEYKARKQELKQKHVELIQATHAKPHTLPYVQAQCQKEIENLEKQNEEELRKKDMKIVLELDQKVMDQQCTLERAGVPGFHVTNNPNDVRLQMYLLEFITRLSQKEEFANLSL